MQRFEVSHTAREPQLGHLCYRGNIDSRSI